MDWAGHLVSAKLLEIDMKQIGKYLAATVLVSASPLISAAEYTLFIYESPVELAKRPILCGSG